MESGTVTPENLYQAYYARLYQRVYRLLGHREQAEDVTHDAFLKAFRALPTLPHTTHLFPWLYRIATNTAYDALRHRRCLSWQSLETENTLPLPEQASSDPQEHYPTQEHVRSTLAQLPAISRRILVMSALEGYALQEIASTCGLTLKSADDHLRCARRAFRRCYAKGV